MNLPDRARPRLTQPPTRRRVARWATAAVWRALHPAAREPFVEQGAPLPVSRVHYRTEDGWQAPLFRLEPTASASGEPVLIAHGAGFGPDLFRYGTESLVGALRAAGFAPWLLTHRLDRDAFQEGPATSREARVEEVVSVDLPTALDTIAEHSGFPRVFVIGHGLGGVLALASAARRPEALAGVVALGAPLRLPEPSTQARASLLLSMMLHADLPLRALARMGVPFADEVARPLAVSSPPQRLRGALAWTTEDLSRPWMAAVRRWWRDGEPTLHDGLIEVASSLADATVPLMVVSGSQDPVCPHAAAEVALRTWGHGDTHALRVAGSHLDLLLGHDAARAVHRPVTDWLDARRHAAWSEQRAAS